MAAESPKKPFVAPSAVVSSACRDQVVPERVSRCAAAVPELWLGAPTTVVDPETAELVVGIDDQAGQQVIGPRGFTRQPQRR
jgi:hypothetical protein